MRHVAAYVLAVMGGNANPKAKDIKEILSSVGIEADDKSLKVVIDQLNGKNLFELMEEGKSLLADMPMGGGSGPAAAPVAAAVAVEAPKVEEKKPVVESDSSDSDMGMGLFD